MYITKPVPNIAKSMVGNQVIPYHNVGFHLEEETTTYYLRDMGIM